MVIAPIYLFFKNPWTSRSSSTITKFRSSSFQKPYSMPKAERSRKSKHQPSAKLGANSIPQDDLPLEPLKSNDKTSISAQNHEPIVQQSKKAKQIEKREAFLQKLEPSIKHTSKSHERRMKRKAKEQLTGDLNDLQSALASLQEETTGHDEPSPTKAAASHQDHKVHQTVKPGTIGKGRSSTLSKAQRKRALELERLRHPLILANSEYSSNPFQTIRTHAQNTLLTHTSTSQK